MGLIKMAANIIGVAADSVSSTVKDQYLEFFTCDSLGTDVLLRKGAAKINRGKNKGNEEVITNGSKIAVPEGTALILVDNGQVIDFTTESGTYTWDSSSAPSVLSGSGFLNNLKASVKETWERMKMAGEISKEQRVYFINMLEIRDQNFGTASPLPYNDPEYRNIYIRLNGKFSFNVQDPVQFFKAVTGNVSAEYTVKDLMGTPADPKQPRSEFLDHFTEVLNKCGGQDKIMFANLPSEQGRLRKYMEEALDEDWLQNRGIVVKSVAINSITPDDKSRSRIEQVDQAKMFGTDPNALAAQAILGQTEAMNTAAGNANGAVNGLMGMGMVGGMGSMGGTASSAFQFMGQQQQAQPQQAAPAAAQAAAGWTCTCGHAGNTGKFCAECGAKKPEAPAGWTCSCGHTGNTGKFCGECGAKKPEEAPAGCAKCGWKPANGESPKFCPECGNKLHD